ncbi:JAB domain-containing protein [Pusillimonas noertemannii]|uniref:DNA repair protein RadC n=1 Tax=Pusillimonas noertemannii TaxID=305977 RepID=A0A2U1CMB4_9BURK|nr:JAB domain-containing protein [Pusillimonas noertemannii]NYT68846.1 DNA repair protein RadC [Pusillimonas noertemannii]PVY62133.1 DNA repair protein RadC [Pusillimonas noertemannii]TFL10876.1 DNA repair protein RadC [Pusillimonas noertemannii]
MQQYSLSLDLDANNAGALLMRDAGGAMRPASRREILRVARELVQADELRGQSLTGPDAVRDFLRLRFNTALEHEVCGLMLIDTQHRLIDYLEPFRGTLDQAAVYPREIVKLALWHNAKAVFLVHNHPSGAAEASAADIRLTQHLKQALALIDVQLLDHFIVAGPTIVSMAEKELV